MDEATYWMVRYEDAQERLWALGSIAGRGFVSPAVFTAKPPHECVEWICHSCGSRQAEQGPCQNRRCVPGEVARAITTETPTARRLRALSALREGQEGKEPKSDLPDPPPTSMESR